MYADSTGIKGTSTNSENTASQMVPIPLVSFATDVDVDFSKWPNSTAVFI